MTHYLARRDFLQRGAVAAGAAAAFQIVPPPRPRRAAEIPPSEKLNIAGIGVGGMGAANLANLQGREIVALCDVDHTYAANTIQNIPTRSSTRIPADAGPAEGHRWRRDRDARPHPRGDLHGGHEGRQARLLPEAADPRHLRGPRAGPGGQGVQGGHADGHPGPLRRRRPADLRVDLGRAIGEVREVDAWCSLSYYPWGHAYWSSEWADRPKDTPPVPAKL